MELNKNHRECLLNELIESKETLELQKDIRLNNEDKDVLDRVDIRIFLLQQRISLIEKSLIDNEIDF